jgi:membrane associated rhomboid family serine protease
MRDAAVIGEREIRVRREPIFNVPASVLAALGLLASVHTLLWLIPERQAVRATLALAFIPARYTEIGADLPGGLLAAVTSFLTYTLVHADLTHLLINAAWLLAFGSAVAMRIGGLRFVAFSAVCGACGALMFLLLEWGAVVPVVGASGAVSGLMAAAFRFLFTVTDEHSAQVLRYAPRSVPLMSVSAMLTDRRVLIVIAIWIVINFVMAAVAPAVMATGGGIAWQVHLGGFAAGLLGFGFFDPASPPAEQP